MRIRTFVVVLLAASATSVWAAEPGAAGARNRIVGVTVYQSSALVGREVSVPEGAGNIELVVPTLPASTIPTSLYAEGNGEVRVLTTRYRSRPLAQTAQEEVRKLETQLKDLQKASQVLSRQVETDNANLELMNKLEGFTQATMKELTEKGALSAEAVTKLANYIMETRTAKAAETVILQQQIQTGNEQMQYLQREISRVASSSDKTSREAVIVVDKAKGEAGKVMLYYLVSAASWKPQYKVRAVQGKAQADVEYLAAISQQTGEDWTGVDVTLSTAQPMFNAAPPELAVLEVQSALMTAMANAPGRSQGQPGAGFVNVDGNIILQRAESNLKQQMEFKSNAEGFAVKGKKVDADRAYNQAAAIAQAGELVGDRDDLQQAKSMQTASREGQSVTFHLDHVLTIPWRDDEQLIEVSRLSLPAEFSYKAVPVLTQHVYRQASLNNTSKQVILPGEATMYVGTDFVGRASLPLVAIGQSFTAGFGVDPQIQVQRQLIDKTRTIQGGNQVQKFDYRILVSNYKSEAVKLELWDRMPHAEGEAITVTLGASGTGLSSDESYVRDQKPKGLLRWDLTLPTNSSGTKGTSVTYDYKLEYAKDAMIGNFFNR